MNASTRAAQLPVRRLCRRLGAIVAAAALLAPASARAQDAAPPAAAEPAPAAVSAFSDVLPRALPEEDRTFQIVSGAFITAAASDITLSMYQIGRGTAREAGFGGWWQHEPVKLAITKSAMIALFAFELHEVHKDNPRLAVVLGIAATAVETALAVRSARMHAASPAAPPSF